MLADEFLELIEEMREDDKYKFADDILRGIHDTVSRTREVTERQERAIHNIKESKEPKQAPEWKRRYEGYGRGKDK